ncbi:MAG: hypothetical protein ACKVRO_07560 [Micropepsaceae bacterium]
MKNKSNEAPKWHRKPSLLSNALAKKVVRHVEEKEGIDAGWTEDAEDRDFGCHTFLLRARRTTYHDIKTGSVTMRLRPMSDDDPHGDPIVHVFAGDEPPDGDGDEVYVSGMMRIDAVYKAAPTDTNAEVNVAIARGRAEARAWSEKWSGIEPNFDERDVVGPIWQELEMPGYLIPDLKASEPYDWSKPLEYGMASMPEFSFILPMDDEGKRFGHDEHYIYSWANPTPTSDNLSSAENERRKVTVKFRYRVVGWTFGWREDHQSKHGL